MAITTPLPVLLQEIQREDGTYSLMEVCGTHTQAIAKSGLRSLLPAGIRLISGPGCPVCVTAQGDIDTVLELVRQKDVVLATFGDMMRVPGSEGSLEEERAKGAKIRVVYSPLEAVEMAFKMPEQEVVFLGIGFETTAPAVAVAVQQAAEEGIKNFSVWSLHKLVPPALEAIFSDSELNVDGLICPGHVSVITGIEPYELLVNKYGRPCVITGFETQDIVEGVSCLLMLLREGQSVVKIQYRRAVRPEGNPTAREMMNQVFRPVKARWRGLGDIPLSGLAFRSAYQAWDARQKFEISEVKERPIQGCRCGEVLRGGMLPSECEMFGQTCTPTRPVGPCMVSQEGSCAAYWGSGR